MDKFFLKKIQAKNFRNISTQIIEFDKNLVCFFGENAQGKTNVLELIYCLFYQKSFKKKADFSQLLAIDGDKPEIYLSGVYETNEINQSVVTMSNNATQVYLNKQLVKKNKIKDSVFVLVPVDSYNFFTDRHERITWLDKEIIRHRKHYAKALSNFQKGLRQRNFLLNTNKQPDLTQIKAITSVLAKYCYLIQQERAQFIENIKDLLLKTFQKLFLETDVISIDYVPSFKNVNSEHQILEFWQENFEYEAQKRISKFGCHLDDVAININGFPISAHASMGQQKMAYFSLFFTTIFNQNDQYKLDYFPLILLDDISSEIDSRRWNSLIKYLLDQHFQVFLTTANPTFLETLKTENLVNVFLITNGSIKRI